ncbi:MAG: CheA signal transduction histidine kinase [Labilithrix sp.]|nr:CheA signal transduction histidine kinase [Labilithrix sp.]
MAADPYRYFRIEAAELQADLGQGVLALERGDGGSGARAAIVARLLRLAHTLKGAARVVRQREIADHAHAIEEVLGPYREGEGGVAREHVDLLLARVDGIAALVKKLGVAPAKAASAPAAPPPEPPQDTVRTSVAEINLLVDGIGEASALLGTLRRGQGPLGRARRLVDLLASQLASPRLRESMRGAGPTGALAAAKTYALAEELQDVFDGLERTLGPGIDQLDQELRQVRESAEQLRLVPAASLFAALERAVRDVAQAQGKRVVVEGRGGDVRLDAHVLAAVQGALLQVARNAVAHGIEDPERRRASGKDPTGRVILEIVRRGRRVSFLVRDDGRGIDLEAVRAKAEERGLVARGEVSVEPARLLQLLLHARLSTSASVTELSGRGIGLDLLRAAAEQLAGHVEVRTEAGQGSTFELLVPVSLASVHALLVTAAGETVAIPLEALRETIRLPRGSVVRTPAGEQLAHGSEVLPFVPLGKLLASRRSRTPAITSADPAGEAPFITALVVRSARGVAAIGVDRLLGTATVVQRPLPALAPATAVVAGSSIDADGNPQLVLDPEGLVLAARGAGVTAAAAPVRAARRVLVIDDSMTTRMLEQSILESAGFDVEVASSAEEGLDKIRASDFALVLVDVEMPRMDGFTFIETVRADPRLRDIPCILVTSRADEEDRRRGREVGANGHIQKGEFDQNELLARIRELVS